MSLSTVAGYSVVKLIAASERSERVATLILTGFLWPVWPSKFGHEFHSQKNSRFLVRLYIYLAIDDFLNTEYTGQR